MVKCKNLWLVGKEESKVWLSGTFDRFEIATPPFFVQWDQNGIVSPTTEKRTFVLKKITCHLFY